MFDQLARRLPPRAWAALLALLTLLVLSSLALRRTPVTQVWADEGTYLAMAESLRHEFDLKFDERDLARIDRVDAKRAHVILQKSGEGIAFSKPALYPLLAFPFLYLSPDWGLILANLAILMLALAVARSYLRRLADRDLVDPGRADLVLVTFLGAAVMLPYVFWRMSDSMLASLALIGLILTLGEQRLAPDQPLRRRIWLGIAILGLLASLRISNLVLPALPLLGAILARRWSAALRLAGAALLFIGLGFAANATLTGAFDPYRAIRTSFNRDTGYPISESTKTTLHRFDENRASHNTELSSITSPSQAATSLFYFFFGRHTGLLFYFPAAVLFLILSLRRNDAPGWAAGLGFLVSALFFVGLKPDNYFGGETFLGNRYLLAFYPTLLVALPRLPRPGLLLVPWLVATASYGSALIATTVPTAASQGSQSHAEAGIFRYLPYESTSQFLEGSHDVYWSGDYLRFTDSFAEVKTLDFELVAGRPPAEILIAHAPPLEKLRLLVATDAAQATLQVADFRRSFAFPVGRAATQDDGLGVPIEFRPSTPWRNHRFWFDKTVFPVRLLRFRLEAPSGTRARISYLGDPLALRGALLAKVAEMRWPEPAAGQKNVGLLRVYNASGRFWENDDVTAVTGRTRLWRLEEGKKLLEREGERLELPRRIGWGELLELEVPISWPATPGRYEIEVDLVLEHIAWFQEARGEPMARREFQVEAASTLP